VHESERCMFIYIHIHAYLCIAYIITSCDMFAFITAFKFGNSKVAQMYPQMHVHMHTRAHKGTHTHTKNTHTHTFKRAHARAHTPADIRTKIQTHTYTYTHVYTHAHTHTDARTCTHKHCLSSVTETDRFSLTHP